MNKFSKELLIASFFFLVVAVIFTWPLAANINTAIPQGHLGAEVAYSQLFPMQWMRLVLQNKLNYWSPPVFYPFEGALSWSEPHPLTSIIFVFLSTIFADITSYNLLIFLYLVIAGLSGYATARILTADKTAALFSGSWLCAGTFSIQHLTAFPLLGAGIAFIYIVSLIQFCHTSKKTYLVWSAISLACLWYICKYLAFMSVILFPVALVPWWRELRSWKKVLGILASVSFSAAAALPYGLPQLMNARTAGFQLSIEQVSGVLDMSRLFVPVSGHWVTGAPAGAYSSNIGITIILIVLIFLPAVFKTMGKDSRKATVGLLLLAACAFFLALGPKTGLYRFLFLHFSGFDFIRMPRRSVMFTAFALSVLSAPALAFVRSRIEKRFFKIAVTCAFFLALGAEMCAMPLPLVEPFKETCGHQTVLKCLNEKRLKAPLLEIPVTSRNQSMEGAAMLRSLEHGHPIVQGYLSFTPVPYVQLKNALLKDAQGKGARYIAAYGIRYVLVHLHLLRGDGDPLLKMLGIKPAYLDGDHAIFERDVGYPVEERMPLRQEKAIFSGTPLEGKIYSLKLAKPLDHAALFMLSEPALLETVWRQTGGLETKKILAIRGSVILDEGAQEVFFRLSKYGPGNKTEGILVSPEKIKVDEIKINK